MGLTEAKLYHGPFTWPGASLFPPQFHGARKMLKVETLRC